MSTKLGTCKLFVRVFYRDLRATDFDLIVFNCVCFSPLRRVFFMWNLVKPRITAIFVFAIDTLKLRMTFTSNRKKRSLFPNYINSI